MLVGKQLTVRPCLFHNHQDINLIDIITFRSAILFGNRFYYGLMGLVFKGFDPNYVDDLVC